MSNNKQQGAVKDLNLGCKEEEIEFSLNRCSIISSSRTTQFFGMVFMLPWKENSLSGNSKESCLG